MITAIYHIMVNIVNKLFNRLGSNPIKKYSGFVEEVNLFEKNNV